jgi:PAS domain S-box-containing protein
VIAVSGVAVAALVSERTALIRDQAAREARRQGEERYREIAETANEGIWILDSNLLTCFVNRRMAEMLGSTVDDMLGKPVFAFMFEDDVEQKRADLDRRKRGVSELIEGRYRRRDGSELWARVSTTPSFSADGTFEGELAMVNDITDQRCTEAQRRDALARVALLSRAVEQTADSVMVANREGIIEYVNPAFEATTGYTRDEAIGQTPRILKSGQHDSDFYRRLWEQILAGRPFRETIVNRKKAGELYWAEQTITPIKNDDGVSLTSSRCS